MPQTRAARVLEDIGGSQGVGGGSCGWGWEAGGADEAETDGFGGGGMSPPSYM